MHKSVESLGELISKRFDVELAERAWSAQAEEGEVELKSKTLVLSTKGIILRRNLSHPVFIKSSVRCTSRLGGAAIAGCSTLEMSFSALILILIFHSPFYCCATSVFVYGGSIYLSAQSSPTQLPTFRHRYCNQRSRHHLSYQR